MKRLGVTNLPFTALPTIRSAGSPNHYKDGVVDSVIDGDSVWFWIDLDFDGLWAHRNCRLIGIDAPDKNPAKLESCNWLKGLLPPHQKVSLFVPGLDKYGRPLVGVYLDDNETSLNLQSLALGLSVPYQGGAR